LTPQIRTLEVPIDSALAINTRTHQMQNKQEQEQLKKLVSTMSLALTLL
jgi:regulator of nonsense transcripts 2